MRAPAGRVAIGLCLSVLAAPAPRPHHRRVAAALMEDAAARHEGRVFTLASGDMVLLCRAGDGAAAGPLALPALLDRLFQLDRPAGGGLVRSWRLDREAEALAGWCADHFARADAAPPSAGPRPEGTGPGDDGELDALLARGRPADLLRRSHAVLLVPGGQHRPLFRDVAPSQEVLDALLPDLAALRADPVRERSLAARTDEFLLRAAADALRDAGGTLAGPADAPPLHLALTPGGVLSPDFARFAAAVAGRRAGVELALAEAAEPDRFARARGAVRDAGLCLVLGGITELALRLFRPDALGAELFKLHWSPRVLLDDPAAARELDEAVARIGPDRIVLCDVDSEPALAWGLARGVRGIHGRYAEATLAVTRRTDCAHAAACTLRQCMQRAHAAGPAPRAWCRDLALLDGAGLGRPGLASAA